MRKEAHDRAELAHEWTPGDDRVGRDPHQVVLVVPGALQQRSRGAMQSDDFARARMLRGKNVELGGIEVGELSVRGHERFLGGGVPGDGREQTGVPRQRAAHRRCDDGGRDRAPGRGRELGRAEQFREPVNGEERHADDARSRLHRNP